MHPTTSTTTTTIQHQMAHHSTVCVSKARHLHISTFSAFILFAWVNLDTSSCILLLAYIHTLCMGGSFRFDILSRRVWRFSPPPIPGLPISRSSPQQHPASHTPTPNSSWTRFQSSVASHGYHILLHVTIFLHAATSFLGLKFFVSSQNPLLSLAVPTFSLSLSLSRHYT